MKAKRVSRGFANDGDVVPRLEGMEVEFDEKVTLFPVELEEIRNLPSRNASRAARGGKSLH